MSVPAHARMVALVREARGWSQNDLAHTAGVSQGFVSKVENGLTDLHGQALETVAAALGCPVSLLTDYSHIQGLEVTCLHHRRRHSKITAAKKRQIEAVTNLTRISVEGLLAGIELLPEARVHRIDIDEVNDPAEIARQIRAAWRVPSGPIQNLTALLEAAGIVVVQRPLGSNAQDAVSTWPHEQDRPPVMLVNAGLPPDRYRFTVAHELGHLVMHSIPSEDQETQADMFASELLAPAHEIGPQLAGLTTRDLRRLQELKSSWGISIAALVRRAKDVGAITDRQYREFQLQLSRLGWRTLEPVALPAEQPSTIDRIVATHRDQHQYSDADLAAVAQMTPAAFTKHYAPPVRNRPTTTLRLVSESHDRDTQNG